MIMTSGNWKYTKVKATLDYTKRGWIKFDWKAFTTPLMQSTMQQTTEQLVAKIKNPIIKWNHHTGSHLLSEHKMRMLGFPSFYYKV